MISFSCKCGKKYEVPEKYAGKKVRCKKCDNMIRVPCLEKDDSAVMMTEIIEPESERNSTQKHNTKQSVITYVSENSGLPKPLIYTFIGLGIFLVGFMLYFLVFRDTWERDNLMKMSQMISEASQQYNLGNGAGLKTYEELCVLIGDRNLKNERLKLDYSNVQGEYESLKEKIRAEKAEAEDIKRLKRLEDFGNEFAENKEVVKAVESYNKALAIIARNKNGKKEFLLAEQRINKVKPELDIEYTAIKEKEAHDKGMADRGYIKFRGKWMSPEEYEREKLSFPAKEIREMMEERILRLGGLLRTSVTITKGDNLEYPYDIKINAFTSHDIMFDKRPIYIFHVNDELELSNQWTKNGYSRTSVAEKLMKGLQSVLFSLKY